MCTFYHLCYGDAKHKHSIEPSTSRLLVEFANRLSAQIGRSIELIHLPVPRNRLDDAYDAPLADLVLRPETSSRSGSFTIPTGSTGHASALPLRGDTEAISRRDRMRVRSTAVGRSRACWRFMPRWLACADRIRE
jgi:hypothetical protein